MRRFTQSSAVSTPSLLDEGIARPGLIPQLPQQAIALELQRGRAELALARLRSLEPMLGESPPARPTPARQALPRKTQARLAAGSPGP